MIAHHGSARSLSTPLYDVKEAIYTFAMSTESFAEALGRIPSGIFVITVKRGETEGALLASWVQQASFEPPTVSVAVHKDRPIHPLLSEHAPFCINILSDADKDLYGTFVKGIAPTEDVFKGLSVKTGENGVPILADAMAVLECRVREKHDVGDHQLVIADVLNGELLAKNETPRVHVRKNGLSY